MPLHLVAGPLAPPSADPMLVMKRALMAGICFHAYQQVGPSPWVTVGAAPASAWGQSPCPKLLAALGAGRRSQWVPLPRLRPLPCA